MKGYEDVENKTGRLRAAASISLALWLIMCMVLPSRSYASDGDGGGHSFGTGDWAYGIVEGPKFLPNRDQLFTSSWGWIIYAPNKYDAALYVCGMEPSDVSSLTSEQRAKLSNESTGGAFYSLANRIYKVGGGSIPTWANTDLIRTLFTAEDTDYVFGLEVDDMSAVNNAKADLQTILDGGDLGGGGGDEPGQSGEDITVGSTVYTDWTGGSLSGGIINIVHVPVENGATIQWDVSNLSTTTDRLFFGTYTYSGTGVRPRYFNVPTGVRVVTPKTTSGLLYLYNDTNEVIRITYKYTDTTCYPDSNNNNIYRIDANRFSNATMTLQPNTLYSLVNVEHINRISRAYYQGTSNVTPPTPPSQWPETEPQTPTQPTVPTPTTISITISSQPTFYFTPTITTNTNYTNTTYDGTDYSKQLKSIYDELKAFHMDNHLNLNAVLSNFEDIADGLEALGDDLDQQVNWMVQSLKTDIDTNFGELKDYLKELFEWLADELDFTVSGGGYSDSTVVSWLKKIWSKIGSGVDTRPTDPTVDPFSALDWLLRFISTLIDGLADKASDLSEDLQDLLDNISGKFPFSIPWDVVAILTLFAGEPVAPAIDYDVAIWGDIRFEADIDLSEYDSVMEVVRPMELIAFAAYLLWLTPEVLDSMDVTKGMGGS